MILLTFLLIIILVFFVHRSRQRQARPLPPGPKPWPLIGNVLDMPSQREWVTFSDWGKSWGTTSLVSLSLSDLLTHCTQVIFVQ
jgi:hypothetical protein